MPIVDKDWIKEYVTNNQYKDEMLEEAQFEPVLYRWSHGATDEHLGAGIIYYSLVYYLKARTCVCLGSGGGFVPRIMSQARLDLWKDGTFEGQEQYEYAKTGTTVVVDACNGVNGITDWEEKNSFFRLQFQPKFLKVTTKEAFYNFFVKHNIKIDYLHIDADHSYDEISWDFENYSTLLSENGVVTIHDTDARYPKEIIIPQDQIDGQREIGDTTFGPPELIKDIKDGKYGNWQFINMFNLGNVKNRPSDTGVTILRKEWD
jgi:hypothetical protein